MVKFTPEVCGPSKKTLEIIRQIAYTYRVNLTADGALRACCLN